MNAVTMTPAHEVDLSELEAVQQFAADLPQGSPVGVLLQHIVTAFDKGFDVAVLTADRDLTPNEAADLLQMSRPHLYKLLDKGVIAFHRVGTHRRINTSDLLDYLKRRELASARVASAIGNTEANTRAHLAEVAGISDDDAIRLGL